MKYQPVGWARFQRLRNLLLVSFYTAAIVLSSNRKRHYGNVNPDRAFTAEISDELIAPDAFTSNWKLSAVVACPERAFKLLMSLEFTDRVLFTSPTRNPIEAE